MRAKPALVVVLQRQAMHRSGQHQQGAPVLARLRLQLQPADHPRRQHLLRQAVVCLGVVHLL